MKSLSLSVAVLLLLGTGCCAYADSGKRPEPQATSALQTTEAYLQTVEAKFQRAFFPPQDVQPGKSVVSFQVDKDGKVSKIKVVEKPKYKATNQLDVLAGKCLIYAVENLNPPPPPNGLRLPVQIQMIVDDIDRKEPMKMSARLVSTSRASSDR